MRMNGKSGLAWVMVGCGALILISSLGWMLHWLAGLLFPAALVALGYYGLKRGRSIIGWTLLGIGSFALLVKLSGLIAVLLAAGFICYGLSLLKNKRAMRTEV